MRHIDELHLEHPFMGARMLRDQLNRQGFVVGRKHVSTLMKRMGGEALDTTYIAMAKGFAYLTTVVGWASRKVLASKVAITLESCHAVDVLQEAFTHHRRPEIVTIDQGSQFTADEFVQTVKNNGCKVSMDGRGAWRDNVIVERLWKSVKYERVYLYAYDSVTEARQSILEYKIGRAHV